MKNLVNRMLKKIGYTVIHLTALIESYAISLLFTGSLIAFILAFVSVFTKTLPVFVYLNYAKLYFLACLPFALVYFTVVEVKLHAVVKKSREERKMAKKLGEFKEKREAEKAELVKEAEKEDAKN